MTLCNLVLETHFAHYTARRAVTSNSEPEKSSTLSSPPKSEAPSWAAEVCPTLASNLGFGFDCNDRAGEVGAAALRLPDWLGALSFPEVFQSSINRANLWQ
jgi:hypothetical protein